MPDLHHRARRRLYQGMDELDNGMKTKRLQTTSAPTYHGVPWPYAAAQAARITAL